LRRERAQAPNPPPSILNPQPAIDNLPIRNLQFAICSVQAYYLQWFFSLSAARSDGVRRIALRQLGLIIVATGLAMPLAAQQPAQPSPQSNQPSSEHAQRLEGEAIVALADAALAGKAAAADFQVEWQNEFLKAQRGTFVPFTLTIDASRFSKPAVLVYVRAVRREPAAAPFRSERPRSSRIRRELPEEEFAVDAIFPAELAVEPGQVARIRRGVTLAAGAYEVFVVVRERAGVASGPPRAAVLKQPLSVPDFGPPGLTTSTVIVAERLDVLREPVKPEELAERPYVIGQNDITPATDRKFRKNEELIVVFLVYNPFVTPEKQFDLQVEYHFFRRGGADGAPARPDPPGSAGPPAARDGERYFNHTDPQRFNPSALGGQFDPTLGNPVMAGQGIPLSGFEQGEYRLAIRVTDLLAGTSIVRDVHFTVGS
jgi:hypothetical protein